MKMYLKCILLSCSCSDLFAYKHKCLCYVISCTMFIYEIRSLHSYYHVAVSLISEIFSYNLRKMIVAKITDIVVHDLRFLHPLKKLKPTAKNKDPVYCCAYIIIKTDTVYKGYGLTTTQNEGNEIVIKACKTLFEMVKNKTTTEIYNDFASFWIMLTSNTQFDLEGQEMHLAAVVIVNALWDLWARIEGKPVWKLLVDMTPEQLISTVDFRYMTQDFDTSYEEMKQKILARLKRNEKFKEEQLLKLRTNGYPAYVADGWSGYKYQNIWDISKKYKRLDFNTFKLDADENPFDTATKCYVTEKAIGGTNKIVDMNQMLQADDTAESHFSKVKKFQPILLEEVTSPDDIVGHKILLDKSKTTFFPAAVNLATGAMCSNRNVAMQLIDKDATHSWLMNVAMLGGINEALIMYIYAYMNKMKPVLGTARGVGLGEMVQHLQMWDYICLSQSKQYRMIEFVNLQHGYFENPIHIKNGCYMPPTSPGYSTKLKNKCIKRWSYPEGMHWKHLFKIGRFIRPDSELRIKEETSNEVAQ